MRPQKAEKRNILRDLIGNIYSIVKTELQPSKNISPSSNFRIFSSVMNCHQLQHQKERKPRNGGTHYPNPTNICNTITSF